MAELRKAGVSDINELVNLRILFLKEVQKAGPAEKAEEMKSILSEYFRNNIQCGRHIAFIAQDAGKIIATGGLTFYELAPSFKNPSGKVAYIQNMFTLPEYRKKGIASELFRLLIREAKTLDYKKIVLHATEEGKPIYQKFGFISKNDEMTLALEL